MKLFIFTIVIEGIEFNSIMLDGQQAEAMRVTLQAMGMEWVELEMSR